VDPDLAARILAARSLVDQWKLERARAEQNLATIRDEVNELRASLSEQGIDPADIDRRIAEATDQLKNLLSELESLLDGSNQATS
jgi:chromosome segregation ATPase